jgi:hypothetical protein
VSSGYGRFWEGARLGRGCRKKEGEEKVDVKENEIIKSEEDEKILK